MLVGAVVIGFFALRDLVRDRITNSKSGISPVELRNLNYCRFIPPTNIRMPMQLLAEFDWSNIHLPTPVALSAVALIGYLVGRRKREQQQLSTEVQARRELKRAQAVAKELERIAVAVRRSIATHHSSVLKFKDRVSSLGGDQQEGRLARTVHRGRRHAQADA